MCFAKQLSLLFLVNQEKLLVVLAKCLKNLPEQSSWTKVMQLLFRYFLKILPSRLSLLLHFRFPRAHIFQNIYFSHSFIVAGPGITRQLARWEPEELLILFTFLGWLRLPESVEKFVAWYLWGEIESLTQHSASGLFQHWSLKLMLIFVFYGILK